MGAVMAAQRLGPFHVLAEPNASGKSTVFGVPALSRDPAGDGADIVGHGVKTGKKPIEVTLPLDVINAASVREKSIRHGHPSTLRLWWERRPLATDRRITDWEGAQHLTRSLTAEQGGGVARRPASCLAWERTEKPRALAYRLYSLAERKRLTDEAHACNILVTSWPQIQMEAARLAAGVPEQTGFGFSGGEIS